MIGLKCGNFVNCVMSASYSWNRLRKQWVLRHSMNEQASFSFADLTTAILQIYLFHKEVLKITD